MQTSSSSRTVGLLVALSAILGVVILAADSILRAVPIHFYALALFVVIDFVVAGLVFMKPSKMAFTVAAGWSALRIIIQIGDVFEAHALGMRTRDFANYLFNPTLVTSGNPMGVPAALIDLIMILEVIVVGIALRARATAK